MRADYRCRLLWTLHPGQWAGTVCVTECVQVGDHIDTDSPVRPDSLLFVRAIQIELPDAAHPKRGCFIQREREVYPQYVPYHLSDPTCV